jgi:sugar lactone lactonase YvrE
MLRSRGLFSKIAAAGGLLALIALIGCGNGSGSGNGLRLYIADTGNNEIVRSDDLAGTNWTYYLGPSGNQFVRPSSIAFDSASNIYVVDTGNNRIVRMTNFTGANFASYGSLGMSASAGQFDHPTQIAIDSQNRLYITDTGNNRVVRMDNITGANWVVLGGTAAGSGTNQFNGPTGIALDSTGRIYIADTGNSRIVRMDDMTGTNWITYGSLGSSATNTSAGIFNNPQGVAVDTANRIYVGDSGNNRIVQMADMSGTSWTPYGTQGNSYGQFNNPTTIQTATAGSTTYIYIVDTGNSRIVRLDNITGLNDTIFGSVGPGTTSIATFSQPLGLAIHN